METNQNLASDLTNIKIKTASSILEVDATLWDELSNDKPFQSYQWYVYGEQVMSDCPPVYILAYSNGALIARACLWLIRNEPVPKVLGPVRNVAVTMLKRWPLLICRSPLSYTTGLVIANNLRQSEILSVVTEAALNVSDERRASFIIFDYQSKANAHDLNHYFSIISTPNPGTYMENRWGSMDEYLESAGKKNRQHYRRVLREALRMGIKIERHSNVENLEVPLQLIRNVEGRHGALPNPWADRMLEHMDMINGSFLTAWIENQLVGCGLILEDNGSQMTSTLGLADNIPYVYFMLLYESLKMAFEHDIRLLRWGSGAYDVKLRLGFSLEDNGFLAFAATNPRLQKVIRWLA